jgi:hypothetical protein
VQGTEAEQLLNKELFLLAWNPVVAPQSMK